MRQNRPRGFYVWHATTRMRCYLGTPGGLTFGIGRHYTASRTGLPRVPVRGTQSGVLLMTAIIGDSYRGPYAATLDGTYPTYRTTWQPDED